WDVATGTRRAPPFDAGNGAMRASHAVFSPDGKKLAAVGPGTALIWDVATGTRRELPLETREQILTAVVFRPDGEILAAGGNDRDEAGRPRGVVSRWNAVTGERLDATAVGLGAVSSIAYSPDGRIIVAGGSMANVPPGLGALWLSDSAKKPPRDTIWGVSS